MRVKKTDKDSAFCECGGVVRKVNTSFLKQVSPGDYLIVHAGFAIEKLDEEHARETLRLLRQMREGKP